MLRLSLASYYRAGPLLLLNSPGTTSVSLASLAVFRSAFLHQWEAAKKSPTPLLLLFGACVYIKIFVWCTVLYINLNPYCFLCLCVFVFWAFTYRMCCFRQAQYTALSLFKRTQDHLQLYNIQYIICILLF
jgi:hypothetical protein